MSIHRSSPQFGNTCIVILSIHCPSRQSSNTCVVILSIHRSSPQSSNTYFVTFSIHRPPKQASDAQCVMISIHRPSPPSGEDSFVHNDCGLSNKAFQICNYPLCPGNTKWLAFALFPHSHSRVPCLPPSLHPPPTARYSPATTLLVITSHLKPSCSLQQTDKLFSTNSTWHQKTGWTGGTGVAGYG